MLIELTTDFLGHKSGTRIDVSEADGQAIVASGKAKLASDTAVSDMIAKVMADAMKGITGSLQSAVDASLKEFATAQTLSRKNGNPRIYGEGKSGDPKHTFGRFLLAVRSGDKKTLDEMGSQFREWDGDGVSKKAAMSTETGVAGGYLVPVEFVAKLMALVAEMSIVRPRATVIPMSSRSCQIPAIDVVTAQAAGDTAFLGGVVARWTEEATTLNESEPSLKQIDLVNYELSGYSKVSNTLLQDAAVGLDSFLMQIFSRAIAWYEDYAFIRGNGAAKPLGIQNWTGYVQVTRTTSSHFKLADVAGMYARVLPGFTPKSACWVVHPSVLVDLLTIASTSAAGQNIVLNNLQQKPALQMLGLDVCVSEKAVALGTVGDVSLCDFQHYLIGDRNEVEIAYSDHVAFLTNQSVWRFVSRVGGQPWLRDKVTLADATSTLSPFVGLAT